MLDNVDLMDLMVKPAYDELQQAMASAAGGSQGAGRRSTRRPPRLAEIENLLFFRTRAGESRGNRSGPPGPDGARQASADVAAAALLGLRSARPADFDERPRARFRRWRQAAPPAIAPSRAKRRDQVEVTPDSLLKAAAHRRDALGVEAEPVHPSDVAGVLDLDAAIHDDRQAARLRDARRLPR